MNMDALGFGGEMRRRYEYIQDGRGLYYCDLHAVNLEGLSTLTHHCPSSLPHVSYTYCKEGIFSFTAASLHQIYFAQSRHTGIFVGDGMDELGKDVTVIP